MLELRRISSLAAAAVALSCLVAVFAAAPAPASPYVYVPGYGQNNVSGLGSAGDGSLFTLPGSPYAAGTNPYATAATPEGRYLYVSNGSDATIGGYAIGEDGALSPLPGSPYPAQLNPRGLAASPDGEHLYATSFAEDQTRAFAITENGALAAAGPGVATGDGPISVTLTADGTRAYVTNFGSDNITGYAVAADGSLSPTPGGPYSTIDQPVDAAITADGKYLYVGQEGAAGIQGYSIAASGALTELPGSPFVAGGINSPQSVAVAGAFLYVGNRFSDQVVVLRIEANGSLSPHGNAATGSQPIGVETDPAGERLYVSNHGENTVGAYAIAADGLLNEIAGSPFPIDSTPLGHSFAVTVPDRSVEGATLRAKKKQRQKRRKFVVKAKVRAAEAVDVRIGAAFSFGPKKVAYRLQTKNLSLAAGQPRAVKLKPKSRKSKRKLSRLLRKHRRGVGTVKARFSDELGNVTVEKKRVKLVMKKKGKRKRR